MTDTPKRPRGRPKTGTAMENNRRIRLPDDLADTWDALGADGVRGLLAAPK